MYRSRLRPWERKRPPRRNRQPRNRRGPRTLPKPPGRGRNGWWRKPLGKTSLSDASAIAQDSFNAGTLKAKVSLQVICKLIDMGGKNPLIPRHSNKVICKLISDCFQRTWLWYKPTFCPNLCVSESLQLRFIHPWTWNLEAAFIL